MISIISAFGGLHIQDALYKDMQGHNMYKFASIKIHHTLLTFYFEYKKNKGYVCKSPQFSDI